MEVINTKQPQQNVIYFTCFDQSNKQFKIRFNSIFDSGNLLDIKQENTFTYIINTAPDCMGTEFESFTRSWFYFGVKGIPPGSRINFVMKKIHILYSMYKTAPDQYRPVYRHEDGPWKRVPEKCVLTEDFETRSIDANFSFEFKCNPELETFFAFSFPFSYRDNQELLASMSSSLKKDKDIYFHKELLCQSPQLRNVELITISSHDFMLDVQESTIHDYLFPMRDIEPRAQKFKSNKPVVLLTSRVHPGETPASHSMNGVLKFLTDKYHEKFRSIFRNDIRAQLLRKYFVFMLIPMINPDGVANGHYRMDIYNQNLNRYYKNPDFQKQPMIFAIKELVQYLHEEDRLFFYCDLHSHAAKKGCFFFGNALDYVMQVESMLFAKVMSLNCVNFEYESCNFTLKHMFAKDKGEKLTKEGAGRVCVYRMSNIIHSYTLECGFHYSNILNRVAQPKQGNTSSTKANMTIKETDVTNLDSQMYKENPPYYTIEMYEDIGKAMLVSILDIFEKNPCSRLVNTPFITLENLRRELAKETSKIQRFKKDQTVVRKCKRINELAKEIFYDDFQRKNCFQLKGLSSSLAPIERRPHLRDDSYSPVKDRNKFISSTNNNNESLTGDSSSSEDDFNTSEERSPVKSPVKSPEKKIRKQHPSPAPIRDIGGFKPIKTIHGKASPVTYERDFDSRRDSYGRSSFLHTAGDNKPDTKASARVGSVKLVHRIKQAVQNTNPQQQPSTSRVSEKKGLTSPNEFQPNTIFRIIDRTVLQRIESERARSKRGHGGSKLPSIDKIPFSYV